MHQTDQNTQVQTDAIRKTKSEQPNQDQERSPENCRVGDDVVSDHMFWSFTASGPTGDAERTPRDSLSPRECRKSTIVRRDSDPPRDRAPADTLSRALNDWTADSGPHDMCPLLPKPAPYPICVGAWDFS